MITKPIIMQEDWQNWRSQREKLLWFFQTYITIKTYVLKTKGFRGPDGKRCLPLNPSQRINEIRNQGWVIAIDYTTPRQYIYKGHYDDYDRFTQKQFIEAGWVYPSRRNIKRRKK